MRRIILFSLIILLLFLLNGCEDAFLRSGKSELKKENYQDAIKEFLQSLRNTGEENNPTAHYYLAICYAETGDYIRAKAHFDKAMKYGANNKVDVYIKKKKYRIIEAIPIYTLYYHNHLYEEGLASSQGENYEMAYQSFKKATQIVGTSDKYVCDTYVYFGYVCDKLKHTIEMLKAYETAIDLCPANIKAHNNLAAYYVRIEDYGKALEHLNVVLKANPTDNRALYVRGICHNRLMQYDKAISDLEKVTNKEKDNLLAWTYLGKSYFAEEKYKSAINSFEYCVKLKDDYEDGWYYMGLSYKKIGDCQGTIRALEKVTQLNNKNYNAWNHLGEAYDDCKQKEKSKEAFEQAKKIGN